MTFVKTNYPAKRGFDSLVNEFFNNFPSNWDAANQGVAFASPKVNIHETKEAYHLEVLAAGRNKEDFKISTDNGLLTISYEKKDEAKADDYKTVRREFTFRSFKRSFNLDETIDADKIEAKYENGVLKVLLPKKEVIKPAAKEINIQ